MEGPEGEASPLGLLSSVAAATSSPRVDSPTPYEERQHALRQSSVGYSDQLAGVSVSSTLQAGGWTGDKLASVLRETSSYFEHGPNATKRDGSGGDPITRALLTKTDAGVLFD